MCEQDFMPINAIVIEIFNFKSQANLMVAPEEKLGDHHIWIHYLGLVNICAKLYINNPSF